MYLTSRRLRARSRMNKQGLIVSHSSVEGEKKKKNFIAARWFWLVLGLAVAGTIYFILNNIYPAQIRDFPLPDSYGLLVVTAAAGVYTLGRLVGLKSALAALFSLAAAAALSLYLQQVALTLPILLILFFPPLLSLFFPLLRPSCHA